jgi:hypothetical protein
VDAVAGELPVHAHQGLVVVDVGPGEAERFADPQAGVGEELKQRPPRSGVGEDAGELVAFEDRALRCPAGLLADLSFAPGFPTS